MARRQLLPVRRRRRPLHGRRSSRDCHQGGGRSRTLLPSMGADDGHRHAPVRTHAAPRRPSEPIAPGWQWKGTWSAPCIAPTPPAPPPQAAPAPAAASSTTPTTGTKLDAAGLAANDAAIAAAAAATPRSGISRRPILSFQCPTGCPHRRCRRRPRRRPSGRTRCRQRTRPCRPPQSCLRARGVMVVMGMCRHSSEPPPSR